MDASNNETIGDVFRENQDAVITTMVLISCLSNVRDACDCPKGRSASNCLMTTLGELAERLIRTTDLTTEQVANLMSGATRRIVKGVPS